MREKVCVISTNRELGKSDGWRRKKDGRNEHWGELSGGDLEMEVMG